MATGDIVTLRVYSNANAAAYVLAYSATFSGSQPTPLKFSPPMPVETGGRYEVTLQQTAGTYRTFQWKVIEI